MKRCLGCHGIAISEDLFVFELTELAKRADRLPVTKQSILKVMTGLYDPLGVIGPILVLGYCFKSCVHIRLTGMTS